MKVHSDISVQMTLGHGTKVLQITYLIAPCRRSRWDNKIGHLDHPIRSPDGKITPPGRSPTRPGQGRPARHLTQITIHSVSLHWGLTNRPPNSWAHDQSKVKGERPHMSLQWASEVATRRFGWSSKVEPAPTCKETQRESMTTIVWSLRQVEGWMSLSHGSKGHLSHG